jgi:hypothetical protein
MQNLSVGTIYLRTTEQTATEFYACHVAKSSHKTDLILVLFPTQSSVCKTLNSDFISFLKKEFIAKKYFSQYNRSCQSIGSAVGIETGYGLGD